MMSYDVGLTTARVDCAVSTLTALGSKEAEMRIIGCDLHAAQQTIAMLDGDTGEVVERTLTHDGETVREFYGSIPGPAVVGIEATGSMGWFLRLLEEFLGEQLKSGNLWTAQIRQFP